MVWLDVRYWQHLRTYRIQHALPQRPIKLETSLYVCGDHRDTPSVHGAMVSGRRTAEVIVKIYVDVLVLYCVHTSINFYTNRFYQMTHSNFD